MINVGAWNVDNSGYALASNINDINVVDIYADGYVQNANWGNGWNFGTSFATPRVTAEIINFSDEFITPLIQDDSELDPNLVMTNRLRIATVAFWFCRKSINSNGCFI